MRALVVDDDDFTRVLLVRTLGASAHAVVGDCADAASAMRIADAQRPDVAILDLDLGPGPNGIDLAHGLRRLNPHIALIILSSYTDPRLAGTTRELPTGARYLSKRSIWDPQVLEDALAGDIEAPLAERVAEAEKSAGPRRLSDNQVEIMRLVAEGYSNSEIARRRSLTEPAVAKAVARLVKQLDLQVSPEDNVRVLIARAYFDLIGHSQVRRQ